MTKLSIVLATRNEEKNIGSCLDSVGELAGEIVVVDEYSTDKTVEIAKKYGAKVYKEPHHEIFHETKQKALDYASGDWILQLDADERVTDELASEIKSVINLSNRELLKRVVGHPERATRVEGSLANKFRLFAKHQRLIEQRDGPIDRRPGGPLARREIVAFFIPRVNFFLGKPLIHAGVYPDPSIRLIKKGKAHFPAKSVHEIMKVDGEVSWLENPMEHHDSPTFSRYVERMNRYTDLHAQELKQKGVPKNLLYLLIYSSFRPLFVFLNLYIRHKGFLDGTRGFIWSLFSSLHYPISYFKYWQIQRN